MAIAYAEMIKLMNYVQGLGGPAIRVDTTVASPSGTGDDFAPGYPALKNFWESLPTAGCNVQTSYIPWLDTAFTDNGDVQLLQKYVSNQLHEKLWVNTELYGDAQIQTYEDAYAPYQTVVIGVWAAGDAASWPSQNARSGKRREHPSAAVFGPFMTATWGTLNNIAPISTAKWP